MSRFFLILALSLSTFVAACATSTPVETAVNGAYRIRNADKLQFRMLDSVNALREAAGQPPVQLNAQLNAAAATHSRDMSVQNRPWHFGSDGSSPLDRVARTGYPGALVGEAISETYENELQTLTAWMEDPATRSVILDPTAADMGFFWFQEPNGKLWWTLVMAG
ncbi:CAP domain-containing protein [Epibacterium sp. SM1969]|uniref:CAP domain-containing protein n=1 Tax=Tritonibacter aquimaris TaxID=2663379 RepID=A0A844AK31_9RHOB|nr:CAP domain-containing protein [Tritonibacter aquimaris]MQY41890.1 CAP domain-containing protein [Tritonibacter aquimaris]